MKRFAFPTHHLKDAPNDGHLFRVHFIAFAILSVAKAVVRGMGRHDLPLLGTPQLPSPRPLRYLGPLELGELVEDAVRQLPLRAIVSPIVQSADLRSVLFELTPEEVMVGGLAGDAVPILCQHHGNAPRGHEVPHTVHAWSL